MRAGACRWRLAALSSVLVPLTAPLWPASPVAAAGACDAAAYDVRPGDGWFAVAERVDVPVSSLLDANGASLDDALFPGDRLCLPAGADLAAACSVTATVSAGEGWSSIARRSGVSTEAVLAANAAGAETVIHPGDTVCLPAGATPSSGGATGGAGASYTVVAGDSWYWIAERAGVPVRSLLAVNGGDEGAPLFPGEEIRLPEGASTPASAGSSASGWVELAALPTQGPCWYHDTWGAPRSGGRSHVGTDIFTVPGEYVYAVVDGTLTSRKWAQPGNISGNAWRLTAADGTSFFYAHLSDFAPGLGEGSRVEAGQILGWVGDTGNTTVDHLHFEIRPGGGGPVNPSPILRAEGGACNQGTPYRQPGGWVPD